MNAEQLAKQWARKDVDRSVGDKCVARALLVAIEALEQVEAIGEPMDCADIAREALARIRGEKP